MKPISRFIPELDLVERKFVEMGARLRLERPLRRRLSRGASVPFSLDVDRSDGEECFVLRVGESSAIEPVVLDLRPAIRHLLLMVRSGQGTDRFLCGYDEREWFVAAVPDRPPVSTVLAAMEALKPREVIVAQKQHRVKYQHRSRRRTAAHVRQGEWFFIPASDFVVDKRHVLRDEPLSRGIGKPHRAELCYRFGGERVWVCSRHPMGRTDAQYRKLLARNAPAKHWGWQALLRNPEVFVRGRISHPDHKTVVLKGWHRVRMNNEFRAPAMQHVAFID